MASDICEAFGQRVRSLRKDRGWRQADLAEEADVSENYVSELELGRKEVCLRTQVALANALGVTLERLFQGFGRFDAQDLRPPKTKARP